MTTYFTGEPCRNGHTAPRYVSDKRCVQCKADKDARHYAKHGDATRARALAHHEANRDERVAAMRAYHAANKDAPDYQAKRAAYMAANRDKFLATQRAKNSTPEAKAAKAAKKREQADVYLAYENKRRARKVHAVAPWFNEFDALVEREAAHLVTLRREATGIDWQVDHMIPLLARRASGLHCATNLQVIPRTLNAQKCNKLELTEPGEWIRHL